MHDKKFDPDNADRLDRPDRGQDIDWDNLFSELELDDGKILADIGAGTGFYAVPFSKRVGKVYAVDISEKMLARVREKMRGEGISNIEPMLSSEDKIPLPDESVDIAFMASVFHELDGDGTLNETRRILKPGGKLVIIDFKKIEEESGPPLWHRKSEDEAIDICENHGFKFGHNFNAGSNKYGLVFIKI